MVYKTSQSVLILMMMLKHNEWLKLHFRSYKLDFIKLEDFIHNKLDFSP